MSGDVEAASGGGEMDHETRVRLAIAGRIAAGLAANPECLNMRSWEGEVARAAWSVAGRLIMMARSGGC